MLIVWLTTVALLAWTFATVVVGGRFIQISRRSALERPATEPRVAVMIPLRGTEPELQRCLEAVLDQKYTNYAVHVVVDRPTDPVRDVVDRVLETHPREGPIVVLDVLRNQRTTCSLKNSALLQVIAGLSPEVDVIACLDGDAVPHDSWLAALVATLENPDVGVSYGIPCFVPTRITAGGMMRACWWAIASIAMALRGWPWGGSFAMSVSTLRASELDARWARALSTDTVIPRALASVDLRGSWVPGLFVRKGGDLRLRTLLDQIVRYMVARRLYLPAWRRTRIVLVLHTATLVGAVGAFGWACLTGAVDAARVVLAGLLVYGTVVALTMAVVDRVARDRGARGPLLDASSRWHGLAMLLALPATHIALILGAVRAGLSHRVRWKGVTYDVRGPWDVALVSDDQADPRPTPGPSPPQARS